MRGVQISYLIEHPEYIPQLAQWLFEQWGHILEAALRPYDHEGHEDLTPWLGGVFVGSAFRRRGVGAALCSTVEDVARSRGIRTLYLFTLDKQAWFSRLGWTVLRPCVWNQRPGEIMYKQMQTA
jgi:GNAT superfamily N-acetyltransferase